MQVALLGPRDDLIHVRTDLLGAGLDRLDTVVQEQGVHQALLHGLGVAEVGAQLAALVVVSHDSYLL